MRDAFFACILASSSRFSGAHGAGAARHCGSSDGPGQGRPQHVQDSVFRAYSEPHALTNGHETHGSEHMREAYAPLWRSLNSSTTPDARSLGSAWVVGSLRGMPHTKGTVTTHRRRLEHADSLTAASHRISLRCSSLAQKTPRRTRDGSVGFKTMSDEPVHGKASAGGDNGDA